MIFIKSFFSPVVIAFSMYSKIPMPQVEWNEKNMRYAICFFPFVGLVIALFEYIIMKYYSLCFNSQILRVCLMIVIPMAITGGIHIDGFMDTNDALSSYAEKEKRLEILKDPHIGAFAVIHLVIYVLLFSGFISVIDDFAWCLCFCISRILSGLSVVTFKCAKKDGTLYTFAKNADKIKAVVILLFELALCTSLMLILAPVKGLATIMTVFVVFWIYHSLALKKFGGITGDVAGWFLCNAELWMTIAFAVSSSIIKVL